ncbi:MAG: DoxX family membrane protein [Bacteroidales bacterium]|nr:DoxX family membrane protein [Bacteroidales bacterium]
MINEIARGNNFHKVDITVTNWMAKNGISLLRYSIGIIFLWYGMLKFFQGASPAEDLAINTIDTLTFGLFSPKFIIISLALLETMIGLGLIFNLFLRETLLLLYLQMIGTFTPIFLFPGEVFTTFPYALTLEGQYIIKNVVIVSAGIVIGATVRGGKLIAKAKKEEVSSDESE